MPRVPTAEEAVVLQAVRQSIRIFCEKSRAWRVKLGPISSHATDNLPVYDLNPLSTDANVLWVHSVQWMPGTWLYPATDADLAANTVSEYPTRFFCPQPDIVHVLPTPTVEVDTVIFDVSLKPNPDTMTFPSVMYTHWFDTIRYGALAELMDTPKKPYSNEDKANKMYREFYAGCSDARASSDRFHSRAQETWSYPRNFIV